MHGVCLPNHPARAPTATEHFVGRLLVSSSGLRDNFAITKARTVAAKKTYAFEHETVATIEAVAKDLDSWIKRANQGPVIITKRGVGKLVMLPIQVYREMIRREIYNVTGIDMPFTPTFKKFNKVIAFLKRLPPGSGQQTPRLTQEMKDNLEGDSVKYDCSPEIVFTATSLCLMYARRVERYPNART